MNGDQTSPERTQLLDAAEFLIRQDGADGWALSQLAERAGVGLELVQAEFETEWDAFCQVMRRDEERFEAVILESSAETAGGRILAVLEACVPDYDWTFWIELWSLALRDERASALRLELDERFRDVIEEIVSDGVEAGEFSVSDTRTAAITITTLLDAMALQATLGDTTVRPNYMLDACVTVCATLLGAPLKLPALSEASDG
jgi:AcrR family transcriptional regulator